MPRNRITPATAVDAGAGMDSNAATVWKIRHGDQDVYGLGDQTILQHRCLGLICSVQCPGSIVIKTFDAIRELRDAGIVVAGGFHSPMEKECLGFLLRGQQTVIVVPAKGLARTRLPASWQAAIDSGRLLLLSPFADDVRRITKANAQARNEFIAILAAAILIPHASPGGKAETIARTIIKMDKPVFTFESNENAELFRLRARSYQKDDVVALTSGRSDQT